MATSCVTAVYQLTKELYNLLLGQGTNEREVLIEEVNRLMDERENVMKQLQPPYNKEEMVLGQDILKMNEQIEHALNKLFTELKRDMSLVKKRKATTKKYMNPYGDLPTAEGVYLDFKE